MNPIWNYDNLGHNPNVANHPSTYDSSFNMQNPHSASPHPLQYDNCLAQMQSGQIAQQPYVTFSIPSIEDRNQIEHRGTPNALSNQITLEAPYTSSTISYKKHHYSLACYFCRVCSKGFMYKDSLKQHCRNHQPSRVYTCFQCGGFFLKKSTFLNHQSKCSIKRQSESSMD